MPTYDVNCPNCTQLHTLKESDLGQALSCAACGDPFTYGESLIKAREQEKALERQVVAAERHTRDQASQRTAFEAKQREKEAQAKLDAEHKACRKKLDAEAKANRKVSRDREAAAKNRAEARCVALDVSRQKHLSCGSTFAQAMCALMAAFSFIGGLAMIPEIGGFGVFIGVSSLMFWGVLAGIVDRLDTMVVNSWWQADLLERMCRSVEKREPPTPSADLQDHIHQAVEDRKPGE